MFYADFYTNDEVIVQLEVWQEFEKPQLLLKAPGAFFKEFSSKAAWWVGSPHYSFIPFQDLTCNLQDFNQS